MGRKKLVSPIILIDSLEHDNTRQAKAYRYVIRASCLAVGTDKAAHILRTYAKSPKYALTCRALGTATISNGQYIDNASRTVLDILVSGATLLGYGRHGALQVMPNVLGDVMHILTSTVQMLEIEQAAALVSRDNKPTACDVLAIALIRAYKLHGINARRATAQDDDALGYAVGTWTSGPYMVINTEAAQ